MVQRSACGCRGLQRAQLQRQRLAVRADYAATAPAMIPAKLHNGDGGSRASDAAVILPGLGNADADYESMAHKLEQRGAHVTVPELKRWEWGKNARAILRVREYFDGTLKPLPTLEWYVRKVREAVDRCKRETGADSVTFVAHSAAGWLVRVWMERYDIDEVKRVICLGSPMVMPELAGFDQTRGLLTYVERNCPGASDVHFVCAAGKYNKGSSSVRDGLRAFGTGLGYQALCGEAEVWGDGITPLEVSYIDGSEQLVLDDVYHSPLGAPRGAMWYGDDGAIDLWAQKLFENGNGKV